MLEPRPRTLRSTPVVGLSRASALLWSAMAMFGEAARRAGTASVVISLRAKLWRVMARSCASYVPRGCAEKVAARAPCASRDGAHRDTSARNDFAFSALGGVARA